MKRIILSGILFLAACILFAQAPESFKYQAVARDGAGNILAGRTVSFRISILSGSIFGASVYVETHTGKITNAFGLVDFEIGKGSPVTGTFSAIAWGTNSFFIKVEMDPNNGTSYITMGTSQLVSVPYALYSKYTQNGDNWGTQAAVTDATLSGNGLPATPLKVGQQGAGIGQVLKWTGTTWQPGSDIGSLWSLNGTNVFYNGGNVGIGINAPSHLLTINGGTVASYAAFINNNTGSTLADGMVAGINTAKNGYLWNFEDGDMQLGTNNLERMRINSDGKIGIGTSAPAGQLHILANSGTSLPQLKLTESELDYARLMFTNTSFATKNWTIGGLLGKFNTDSQMDFTYSDGVVAPKTVLSVTGDGEVHHSRTAEAHMLPIAYGTVSTSGVILSGTGNFSVVYDAVNKRYEITIDGETYSYSQYATLVTHIGSGDIGFPSVTSGTGVMNVSFYMIDGTKKAAYFSFVVYKP